jgi:hypothetical protein
MIIHCINAVEILQLETRIIHEKNYSSKGHDRDGQRPPAFVIVGAHPEPKTHHQYRQHLFNKDQFEEHHNVRRTGKRQPSFSMAPGIKLGGALSACLNIKVGFMSLKRKMLIIAKNR